MVLRRWPLVVVLGTALLFLPAESSAVATTPTLWFVDAPAAPTEAGAGDPSGGSDLLGLVRQAMPGAVRTGSLDRIVAGASEGDAVLVLAHEYPWRFAETPSDVLLAAARTKRLHLYLEYLQDLSSFNRSHQRDASACLNQEPVARITANISTTVRSLCACEGAGAHPSTLRYTGRLCGNASARSLLWERMENLTPCHDCATKTCAWSTANQTAAWKKLYTGSCGVAPSMLPDLPTHLCDGVVPPAPPAPPSTVTQVSWKKRAVLTTDAAASFGLVRDTILLPQGAYVNGWCAHGNEDEGEGQGCAAGSSLSDGCAEACNTSILSLAKVAGVYKAVYGAPKSIQEPILFEHRLGGADSNSDGAPPALVATTKLSSMISGRFGPVQAWHSLWVYLLIKLGVPASTAQQLPLWKQVVGPAYSAGASLPLDAVRVHPAFFSEWSFESCCLLKALVLPDQPDAAVRSSASWLVERSQLLSDRSDPSGGGATTCCLPVGGGASVNVCVYHNCTNEEVCPVGVNRSLPRGVQNATCIQEGWSSILHWNGALLKSRATTASILAEQKQEQQSWLRAATSLADYLWRWSDSQIASDPSDPAFGIVTWNQQHPGPYAHWASVDYGDNAANVLIGGLVTRALAQTSSWDLQLLRCLLAEARTSGPYLSRDAAVSVATLRSKGWRAYWNNTAIPTGGGSTGQPHYGGYLPAAFLMAGSATTGLTRLLTDRARAYCMYMMAAYDNGEWEWNESMSNEQARFLLPLAWLIRVDDTPLHRSWLDRLVSDLIASQDMATGAIKQEFGHGNESGRCSPCAPSSNGAYGSGEGPIMHDGTEPLADSLYTLSFALAGLREAYGATRVGRYKDAETKLVEFLVRTQVVSEAHPELQGAWFRAFDYKAWEFWASDNDWGYGPWTTETGWSNGWIMSALAMREANTTLWEVAHRRKFDPVLVRTVCFEMLPGLEEYCSA